MKRRLSLLAAVLLLLDWTVPSLRAEAYNLIHVDLFQPSEVMESRLGDAEGLTGYIGRLNAACGDYFHAQPKGPPSYLDLCVAFKPSGKAKVWLVSSDPETAASHGLQERLEKIVPPKSKDGLIVFRVHASLWGYRDEAGAKDPMPAEWDAAARAAGKAQLIDDVVAAVWKE